MALDSALNHHVEERIRELKEHWTVYVLDSDVSVDNLELDDIKLRA